MTSMAGASRGDQVASMTVIERLCLGDTYRWLGSLRQADGDGVGRDDVLSPWAWS